MSDPKAPPLSSQIIQEAAGWFVEFNEGDLDRPNRQAFVDWLKVSPEHIRAYLQVSAHWEEAGAISPASIPSIDALAALARESPAGNVVPIARASLPADASPRAPIRIARSSRYRWAAGIAIAAIGVGAFLALQQERGLYTTDIGEQRSVRLADGSTVDLNAHSKVRVRMREHERDVELLEGQALFRVAKDHARPFIVHSGDTSVLAVGTQFDVNRHRSTTTVTVIEGRVAVFPVAPPNAIATEHPQSENALESKREIFLAAGEQLLVSKAAVKRTPNADVVAATAWTQKQIVFNSTPLSDVVDEFNRYNPRPLVITDPGIADTKISGEFSSTNPDSLLKGLDGLNQFQIRETRDRIEISAR